MPIALGLLTTSLFALAAAAFAVLTGYYFQSYTLFFIVPAGAMICGSFCGYGYFRGLIKKNIPIAPRNCWIAAGLGLLGFAAVYLLVYAATFINPGVSLKDIGGKQTISHYISASNQDSSFIQYMENDINSRSYKLTIGYKRVDVDIPVSSGADSKGSILNIFLFVAEGLGFMLGAVGGGLVQTDDKIWCEHCKVYMENLTVGFNSLAQFERQEAELMNAVQVGGLLAHYLGSVPANVDCSCTPHVRLDMSHCPYCYSGFLTVRHMTRETSKGYDEDESARQVSQVLPHDITDMLAVRYW